MKQAVLFDNYDSFTYNLLHLLKKVRNEYSFEVIRNQDNKIRVINFDALIIGPGPMQPKDTGILTNLIQEKIIPERIPVLGVCLGMQFMAYFENIEVAKSTQPAHGAAFDITHNNTDIFKGVPSPFKGARYNSLEVQANNIHNQHKLQTIAVSKANNSVMALKHTNYPWVGVQFHPESFLTEYGNIIIDNFFKQYVEYNS